jgi:hypothetical protein
MQHLKSKFDSGYILTVQLERREGKVEGESLAASSCSSVEQVGGSEHQEQGQGQLLDGQEDTRSFPANRFIQFIRSVCPLTRVLEQDGDLHLVLTIPRCVEPVSVEPVSLKPVSVEPVSVKLMV